MALISNTIPNLYNGVSQQPNSMRLSSQGEEQINGFSSIVEGLKKRAPTEHVADIGAAAGSPFIHVIDRSPTEKYLIVVSSAGAVTAYNLITGVLETVSPTAAAYLASASPASDLRAVTVADYTFLLNTKTPVTVGSVTVPLVEQIGSQAYIWVKVAAQDTPYTVKVNGSTVTHTTPGAGNLPSTTDIATALATLLQAALIEVIVTAVGSFIHIRHVAAGFQIIDVQVSDGYGNAGLQLIFRSVTAFSLLPAELPVVPGLPGGSKFTMRVQPGGIESGYYFVTYNLLQKTWTESRFPSTTAEAINLNPLTMPHTIARTSPGTWTLAPVTWTSRLVGDASSVPSPSFVGKTLADIFFHRNRLGFIADENVILSKAGAYFDFYPSSAFQGLDDDPIDVSISHNKVSILRHVVAFNKTALIFSDSTQFQLNAPEVLTAATISLPAVTEFDSDINSRPVQAGPNVYFSAKNSSYSLIREYFVEQFAARNNAVDVTAHVPRYIPQGVTKLTYASHMDTIFAMVPGISKFYAYTTFWTGEQKEQSSWSTWDIGLGADIRYMEAAGSTLYIVVARGGRFYLEKIDMTPGKTTGTLPYLVYQDRLTLPDAVTATSATTVTLDLPYAPTATLRAIHGPTGEWLHQISNNGTTVVFPLRTGNPLTSYYIGEPYEFRYEFSRQFPRNDKNAPLSDVKLKLRDLGVHYDRTGAFEGQVTAEYRPVVNYNYDSRLTGNYVVGSQPPALGGFFRIPVLSNARTVKVVLSNSTPYPCYFQSAEWRGEIVKHAQGQ